jgi:hypothetical protein
MEAAGGKWMKGVLLVVADLGSQQHRIGPVSGGE